MLSPNRDKTGPTSTAAGRSAMLTLEQVKKAGRRASVRSGDFTFEYWPSGDYSVWNEAHDVNVDGVTLRVCREKIIDSRWPMHGRLFTGGIDSLHPPQSGWHYLPGCDCEFCKEEA